MDDPFSARLSAAAHRPLAGLTILAVEDSRFASEALRLICQRSGARLRRADTLAHARRHLAVYRPGCVIVDLGLPDGSGLDLIRDLSAGHPRIDRILGMSGDPAAEAAARCAGADGFLTKPLESVGQVQAAILGSAPRRAEGEERIAPDAIAFRDDLHHAAGVLAAPDGRSLDYLAQFLGGVAASAGDRPLSAAVADLAAARHGGSVDPARARLAELVRARLRAAPGM